MNDKITNHMGHIPELRGCRFARDGHNSSEQRLPKAQQRLLLAGRDKFGHAKHYQPRYWSICLEDSLGCCYSWALFGFLYWWKVAAKQKIAAFCH